MSDDQQVERPRKRTRLAERASTPAFFVAMAATAVLVSMLAAFLALTADPVNIVPSGVPGAATPDASDLSLAQVRELQRSNDRILQTVWGALGAVFTIAVLFTGISAVTSRIASDREIGVVRDESRAVVRDGVEDLQRETRASLKGVFSRLDELSSGLAGSVGLVDDLELRVDKDRRERSRVLFDITYDLYMFINSVNRASLLVSPSTSRDYPTLLVQLAVDGESPFQIQASLALLERVYLSPQSIYSETSDIPERVRNILETLPERWSGERDRLLQQLEDNVQRSARDAALRRDREAGTLVDDGY